MSEHYQNYYALYNSFSLCTPPPPLKHSHETFRNGSGSFLKSRPPHYLDDTKKRGKENEWKRKKAEKIEHQNKKEEEQKKNIGGT